MSWPVAAESTAGDGQQPDLGQKGGGLTVVGDLEPVSEASTGSILLVVIRLP